MNKDQFTRATNLDDAVRALEHDKPLGSDDPRYEDFAEARGDDTTRVLKGKLTACERGSYVQVAFLSHRGAGKTTELKRLCADLQHHFECYYFEANLRLDPQHLTTEDLLLALTFGIAEHFESIGLALAQERIDKVHRWFAEILKTTGWGASVAGSLSAVAGAGVDVPVPLVPKLKAELQGVLRSESDYRKQVRDAFRRYPSTLLGAVNEILDAAQARLSAADPDRRLLVVIDNLDRYEPGVVDELLIQRNLLRDLRVSLIVTPPIALYYRPQGEPISAHYECEVMNTIRLRDRDQGYDEFAEDGLGLRLMREALDKRMDLVKLIPDERVVERLIGASGGAIRDLIRLSREAILRARGSIVDAGAVEAAVRKTRSEMRDRINANDWAATLGQIAVEKQVHAGEACIEVLYQRMALKYNGEGWYDIHPLTAEIPEVARAIAEHRGQRGG